MAWWDDSSPNWAFWLVVAACGALLAGIAWSSDFAEMVAYVDGGLPVRGWVTAGRVALAALAVVVGLGVILMILQPARIGNRLTIVFALWRALRFLFRAAAAVVMLWFTITLAVLGFLFLREVYLHASGNGGRTLIDGGRLAWLVIGLFAIVFGKLLPSVLGDMYRLVTGALETARSNRWARQRLREASDPYIPAATDVAPQVVIVSDLHTAAPGATTLEGDLTDVDMRAFVTGTIATLRPKLVLAAGDLTDTGQPEAWARVASMFAELDVRLLAAPGNHDVNFRVFQRPPSRWSALGECLDLEADDPAGSYDRDTLAERMRPLVRGDVGATRFPALHADAEAGIDVLVLDSNRRRSSSPISNAIGRVGDDQIRAADKLLAGRRGDRPLVIVLHHHIFPDRSRNPLQLALVCIDASSVLRLAFAHRAAAIVHGHKHMPYVREVRDGDRTLRLISVGSAMYDAKGPCADQVVQPSCMGLVVDGAAIAAVTLHRPGDVRYDRARDGDASSSAPTAKPPAMPPTCADMSMPGVDSP